MTPSGLAGYSIALHDDIAPLEAEWRALEESGDVTAFQRYDFVAPLYRAFRRHGRAEPLIVTVRNAEGRLAMILPLCRHVENGRCYIDVADLRVADYCAPVLAADFDPSPDEFRRLWRRIERALPPSDVLRLRKLPERVGSRANPLLWLRPSAPYHVRAHGLAIAHPWAEKAAAAISRKQMGELRRNQNNLARLGTIDLTWHDEGPAAEDLFGRLHELRTRRFAALGRDDAMADPMWSSFYRDLVTGETARPGARMVSLTCGGEQVACGLGLVHGETFLMIIPSFDMERFGRFGPGRLLIFRAMEAFAANGLTYFDLTIGDEPYKNQFGVDDRTLFEIVRPRSPSGVLVASIWHGKLIVRRFPRVRKWLKRWLGNQ